MENHSILDQIHLTDSPLKNAICLQNQAAEIGFDWPNISPVFEKLIEEINELKAELNPKNNYKKIMEEFGDILFVCANLARHLNIDPEIALERANIKFIRRFKAMEQILLARHKDFADLDLAAMDQVWDEVKRQEKN